MFFVAARYLAVPVRNRRVKDFDSPPLVGRTAAVLLSSVEAQH
jgi:hypothetical protein